MTEKAIETFRELAPIYEPDTDRCTKDDDRALRMKLAIRYGLTPSERVVLVLYAHFGSLRKLAAAFQSSKTSMRLIVLRIQEKLKKQLKR